MLFTSATKRLQHLGLERCWNWQDRSCRSPDPKVGPAICRGLPEGRYNELEARAGLARPYALVCVKLRANTKRKIRVPKKGWQKNHALVLATKLVVDF